MSDDDIQIDETLLEELDLSDSLDDTVPGVILNDDDDEIDEEDDGKTSLDELYDAEEMDDPFDDVDEF
jgi:hypothetical protein